MGRIAISVFVVLCAVASASMMPGGLTPPRPASADDQKVADAVRDAAQARTGQNFGEFKAVQVRTQVVAGTNYFIKVSIGGGNYVHIRVYKSLPHAGSTLTLSDIQTGKSLHDEIGYF